MAHRERLRGNRWFVTIGVVGLLLLGFALVAPAVIKSASEPATTWAELADIGSAYGGVAAVASTFALLGVCLSLLLQHRQARLQQIFTVRQRHFELLKLSLEQPELMKIFGPQATASTAYFNMFLSHWGALWELGEISETVIRLQAAEVFANSQESRRFWTRVSPTWTNRVTRSRLQFRQIIDDECARFMDDSGAELASSVGARVAAA